MKAHSIRPKPPTNELRVLGVTRASDAATEWAKEQDIAKKAIFRDVANMQAAELPLDKLRDCIRTVFDGRMWSAKMGAKVSAELSLATGLMTRLVMNSWGIHSRISKSGTTSWDSFVCAPVDMGGLGIPDIHDEQLGHFISLVMSGLNSRDHAVRVAASGSFDPSTRGCMT